MSAPLQIGLLVFPKVTQLDLTGPVQVFSSVPGAKLHLIWKRIEPVQSDSVLVLTPTITFAECPQLDVICVPGGYGTGDLLDDEEVLAFLRKQAEGAKFVTSVCTGSLVLGAAGLMRGFRAATHWAAMDSLPPFGAIPTKTRVCIDGHPTCLAVADNLDIVGDDAIRCAQRFGEAGIDGGGAASILFDALNCCGERHGRLHETAHVGPLVPVEVGDRKVFVTHAGHRTCAPADLYRTDFPGHDHNRVVIRPPAIAADLNIHHLAACFCLDDADRPRQRNGLKIKSRGH